MNHLVLLGDSILDNGSYTEGGPDVITHVSRLLPDGWLASLNATDGAVAQDIDAQLKALPGDATHLLLSVGGNNALLRAEILDTPAASTAGALLLLHDLSREFEAAYRDAVEACLGHKLPLVLCTIYHGNFPDPSYRQRVIVALTVFNDVIIRVALEKHLKVIDLRLVCNVPSDFANPIEPSAAGGAKIAQAIVRALTEPANFERGARIVGT